MNLQYVADATSVYWFVYIFFVHSPGKAVDILIAYEGTLEEDYPPDNKGIEEDDPHKNERYEHSEMLLYKVSPISQVIEPFSHWKLNCAI